MLVLQDQSTGTSFPQGFCPVPHISVDVIKLSSSSPCKMSKNICQSSCSELIWDNPFSGGGGKLILVSVIALSSSASTRSRCTAWANSAGASPQAAPYAKSRDALLLMAAGPGPNWSVALNWFEGWIIHQAVCVHSCKIDIRDKAPTSYNRDTLIISFHRHQLCGGEQRFNTHFSSIIQLSYSQDSCVFLSWFSIQIRYGCSSIFIFCLIQHQSMTAFGEEMVAMQSVQHGATVQKRKLIQLDLSTAYISCKLG